jgi:hypothetical protein
VSSETLITANLATGDLHRRRRIDQRIAETLVITLTMMVFEEFADGPSQMALPERNDSIEAFVLDGSHETLRMRGTVRPDGSR